MQVVLILVLFVFTVHNFKFMHLNLQKSIIIVGSTGCPRVAEVLAVLEAVIACICRPPQPAVL